MSVFKYIVIDSYRATGERVRDVPIGRLRSTERTLVLRNLGGMIYHGKDIDAWKKGYDQKPKPNDIRDATAKMRIERSSIVFN